MTSEPLCRQPIAEVSGGGFRSAQTIHDGNPGTTGAYTLNSHTRRGQTVGTENRYVAALGDLTIAPFACTTLFDLWVDIWRRKRAQGEVVAVRYAGDFILGFQYQTDADRFLENLRERLAMFRLELRGTLRSLLPSTSSETLAFDTG